MSDATPTQVGEEQQVSAQMLQEIMPLKTAVRVMFTADDGGLVLNSVIVGFKKNLFFIAALPDVRPRLHAVVKVNFATEKALYSFTSVLKQEFVPENKKGVFMGFELPETWVRVQRRTAFRVDLFVPVLIEPLADGLPVSGRSVNVSATGILVGIEKQLPMNSRFKLSFKLPKDDKGPLDIGVTARLARRAKQTKRGEETGLYLHGFTFEDLRPRDEDRLAQYLWNIVKSKPVF